MKLVTARATFDDVVAEKLFGTRDAARETTRKILESRTGRFVTFKSQGIGIRTERSAATVKCNSTTIKTLK